MSTSNFVARYERLPLEWVKRTSFEDASEVSVQRSVNADRSRLFQALTLPEYIDAWFVAPGSVPGSTAVAMGPDCFVVSYRLPDGGEQRFIGSYKVLRRGKVQFAWRRDSSFHDAGSSLVRIRLQGDFGRTTVQVTHVGLDEREHAHYQMLWEASLERLASLF
ncbi:MAG: SRPBCC domain-containing protein [Acidobacteria bacterium]|nr:SRPBCC domain-containing protein [Acidobacteriota bacterium]